jgi:putative endonuclease
MGEWLVYILECSDGSLYTGITNNLERRFKQHNNGKGAKYTRARTPLSIKGYKVIGSKSDAAKEEYRIKQLKRSDKLELIKCWLKDG